MDHLKDYFDAISERVKSPLLGSFLVAFFVTNWKPIFYLFFAETSASVRIRFFTLNTDLMTLAVFPLIAGSSLAICLPRLNLVAAQLIKHSFRLHRRLQADEATKRAIYHLELKAQEEDALAEFDRAKEQRKIDAEKRLLEANRISPELGGLIIDSRARSAIDLVSEAIRLNEELDKLDMFEREVILSIGKSSDGIDKDGLKKSLSIRKIFDLHETPRTQASVLSLTVATLVHGFHRVCPARVVLG